MSSKKNSKKKPASKPKSKAKTASKPKSRRPSVATAKPSPKAQSATVPATPAKVSGESKPCKCGCEGKTEKTFVRGHYGTYLNSLRKVDKGLMSFSELPKQVQAALPSVRHVRGELSRLKPMGTSRRKKAAA